MMKKPGWNSKNSNQVFSMSSFLQYWLLFHKKIVFVKTTSKSLLKNIQAFITM